MINLKKYQQISIFGFLLIEVILYCLIHLNLLPNVSKHLMFASIFLCFLFALIFSNKKSLGILSLFALLFTICADFILLYHTTYKVLAMVFFCTVQIFYFLIIFFQSSKKQKLLNIYLRFTVILILEIVLALFYPNFDFLIAEVGFYFPNLVISAIFAFFDFKQNKIFAIGLLLFILCDIFVGLGELGYSFGPANLAWIFYIPSQVLLALNVFNTNKEKIKKKW